MKLTLTTNSPKMTAGLGQNEKQADRITRMTAYWNAPENQVLYPVGKLLALPVDKSGKTIADVIAAGGSIELGESIEVDGKSLPLQPGYTLSLVTLVKDWSCPACRSAHGSGVYPSGSVSANGLKSNRFFYRPADRSLFTISDTCWKAYVAQLGAFSATRFMSPATAKPVAKPAKSEKALPPALPATA